MEKSTAAVDVVNALLIEGHWLRWFAEIRIAPLNFPVNAGLSVMGEAKNCEKCGSCAKAVINTVENNAASMIFFIRFDSTKKYN